ncbi:MAG: response regulator transcription factor [Lautropia sp.]
MSTDNSRRDPPRTAAAALPRVPANERLVYVVDDDEAVRDSLRWLLEGNGFGVRTFASAEAFLQAYDPAPFACLVLDVRMTGMSGIELHDELLRRGHDLPLIFMTGHGDVPMAVARMKLGAIDFLEKPFDDQQLCRIVALALDKAVERRSAVDQRERNQTLLGRLTPRERQVLDLIAAGRLNKQIADDLSISIKTVEAHRANIMDKFEVRTMADLMRKFLNARRPDAA